MLDLDSQDTFINVEPLAGIAGVPKDIRFADVESIGNVRGMHDS